MLKEILEEIKSVNEKLITFGNKRPKYNNVVLLAGGAASGKGFVLSNLIGIEGKVFDVDHLKDLALSSVGLKQIINQKYNVNLNDLDLKNPEDTSILHWAISKLGIDKKLKGIFLSAVNNNNQKPNIIFDTTLKDMNKIINISDMITEVGYKKENIHIVWVLTDVENALYNNLERPRHVKDDILKNTHEMVSQNIANIIANSDMLKKYVDGDFWIVFNKRFNNELLNDLQVAMKKRNPGYNPNKGKALYIKDAIYFKIKSKNGKILKINDIVSEYLDKIRRYVPNPELWQ